MAKGTTEANHVVIRCKFLGSGRRPKHACRTIQRQSSSQRRQVINNLASSDYKAAIVSVLLSVAGVDYPNATKLSNPNRQQPFWSTFKVLVLNLDVSIVMTASDGTSAVASSSFNRFPCRSRRPKFVSASEFQQVP
eukprot:5060310-Amphidinium_carterae.1